ncbi:hypothetical protein D3C80_2038940 [compost metagenome]
MIVGRGEIDHARLRGLLVLRLLDGERAFGRKQGRQHIAAVGGHVQDHQDRQGEVGGKRRQEGEQRLHASGRGADHDSAGGMRLHGSRLR